MRFSIACPSRRGEGHACGYTGFRAGRETRRYQHNGVGCCCGLDFVTLVVSFGLLSKRDGLYISRPIAIRTTQRTANVTSQLVLVTQ